MNASGDVITDWQNHLEMGRTLLSQLILLNATYRRITPLGHMDEYKFGNYILLEKKVVSVVEATTVFDALGNIR